MEEKVSLSLHGAVTIEVQRGLSFLQIMDKYRDAFENLRKVYGEPVAIQFEDELLSLNERPNHDGRVCLITKRSFLGEKIIQRTLIYILGMALVKVLPEHSLKVLHSYGAGIFCVVRDSKGNRVTLKENQIDALRSEMRRIIDLNCEIKRIRIDRRSRTDRVLEELNIAQNVVGKEVIERYRRKYFDFFVSECDNFSYAEYSTIPLLPSTGLVKGFDIKNYPPGLVLVLPKLDNLDEPREFEEIPALFQTFHEYSRWLSYLKVDTIADLNEIINKGKGDELISIAEALHERKIIEIADEISRRMKEVKLVLIAGPSSAGKTTFSKRLAIQLRATGINPITISMDDYFLDREYTPVTEDGRKDFDSPDALDKELFISHLRALINGEEVELPKYNFHTGKREKSGRVVRMTEDSVLIVEGIHALNPVFSASIPSHMKFKVYVSALAQLNIDDKNRIHTTDNRLLRRMVRDSLFRSYGVLDTIRQWPLVRRGEVNYIFPYQNTADAMFNSALPYELAVLKPFVEPMLKTIPYYYPEYPEAKRLLDVLEHIEPMTPTRIPPNSILREFIGGSIFEY